MWKILYFDFSNSSIKLILIFIIYVKHGHCKTLLKVSLKRNTPKVIRCHYRKYSRRLQNTGTSIFWHPLSASHSFECLLWWASHRGPQNSQPPARNWGPHSKNPWRTESCCMFPAVAVTNYYKLSILKTTIYYLTVLKIRSLK